MKTKEFFTAETQRRREERQKENIQHSTFNIQRPSECSKLNVEYSSSFLCVSASLWFKSFFPIRAARVRTAGFSLVEVMCAVLIMGVALVALTRGMTTALGSSKDSEVQTTIVGLAAGQLETLRAGGFLVDDTTEGDFGESFPRYKYTQTVSPSDVDGLHKVEVEVQDTTSGKALYKLTTLLFDNDYPVYGSSEAKQKQRDADKAKKRNRRGQ